MQGGPRNDSGGASGRGGVRSAAVVGCSLAALLIAASSAAGQVSEGAGRDGADLARWLDERLDEVWREEGIEPELCDDAAFARRVSLDLIGRIPSVAEVRTFLEDRSPDRHARLVDRLLGLASEPDAASVRVAELHAEHFARIWRRIMIPPGTTTGPMAARFEPWLQEQFRRNVGYDELARRVIAARGEDAQPVGALYQAVGGTPDAYATAFSRIFLGVRLGCAQCHDHPFASWKQHDFWGMAAFFAGANPANNVAPPGRAGRSGTILFEGVEYRARFPWSDEQPAAGDPRTALAAWLTSPENPNFAATAVNRAWQHLLGQGLTEGVDDLDFASPDERARVLDPLAEKFAAAGYDLKWLVAGIAKSRVYRSTSGKSGGGSVLAGVRPLKTLTPEQLFDSLEQALMLPVSRTAADAARHTGLREQLIARFDESAGQTPEEYVAGVPQVLMLMNGKLIADATSLETSRTLRAVVDAPFLGQTEKIETLYLAALTRRPTERELSALNEHLETQPDEATRRQAYAEIFWALLNSPEFVLCR